MRTLSVHRQVADVSSETLAKEELLLRRCHIIKKTLYWVGALLVTANLDKFRADFFKDTQSLVHGTTWEQNLEEVVSVLVKHDFFEATHDEYLRQYLFDRFIVCLLELFLQITRSALWHRKTHNLTFETWRSFWRLWRVLLTIVGGERWLLYRRTDCFIWIVCEMGRLVWKIMLHASVGTSCELRRSLTSFLKVLLIFVDKMCSKLMTGNGIQILIIFLERLQSEETLSILIKITLVALELNKSWEVGYEAGGLGLLSLVSLLLGHHFLRRCIVQTYFDCVKHRCFWLFSILCFIFKQKRLNLAHLSSFVDKSMHLLLFLLVFLERK